VADFGNQGLSNSPFSFGVIDPEVSAAGKALRNNERPETQAGAARLRELIESEIEYREYDEIYRTDR
jgi:hypothetical protein